MTTSNAKLKAEIKALQDQIDREQNRSLISVSECSINMAEPDKTKIAIAEAVREGMKALQSLGGNSYGIYIDSTKTLKTMDDTADKET